MENETMSKNTTLESVINV